MPEVSIDGEASAFHLRPSVDLPERETVTWNGDVYSFRWHPNGAELPFPPHPGDSLSPPLYGSIALIGETDDVASAFILSLVLCNDGYDPEQSYSTSMPSRLTKTGEWVFDLGTIRCDD